MEGPEPTRFVVTGGSRGIGRAIAALLLRRGGRVLTVARQFADPPCAGEIQVAADLTDPSGLDRLMDAVAGEGGGLDGLINNAGRAWRAPALGTDAAAFRAVWELNVLAPLELSRRFHPFLKARRGCIVNVGSVTSRSILPDRLAYGTSKAALEHVTRSLAVEWGPDGIRVNAVLPWFTRTEMVAPVLADPAVEAALVAVTPLGRLAEPADVAHAVVFLTSPEAGFITGQTLAVDGGFLSRSPVAAGPVPSE